MVAVVAKGTGSYLTDVWLIELRSGVAMAPRRDSYCRARDAHRSNTDCAAGQTTNAITSTVNMIAWTSTHSGSMLGEGRLNTLPEGPLCPLSLRY